MKPTEIGSYDTLQRLPHHGNTLARAEKLATGWDSLKDQVRRWQASIGLSWSEEDIADVARYLNTRHYGFPVPGQKGLSQDRKPVQALRRNSNY